MYQAMHDHAFALTEPVKSCDHKSIEGVAKAPVNKVDVWWQMLQLPTSQEAKYVNFMQ